jgi:tRNA G18 (ribose-2'-O)-methylase SpoU
MLRTNDLISVLRELKTQRDVSVAATVLDDEAERLDEATRPARFALLFGSEGFGLEENLIAQCDRRITLPMGLGVDSLNVAVAAGVFLYHFTRNP